MLCAREISLAYRRRGRLPPVAVLAGFSLTVGAGERVGVTGPSGSGKSSLLHLLGGLRRPQAGEIVFGGRDLVRLSPTELGEIRRRHFGFVFQQHFLLNYLTVEENVMVPAFPGDGEAAHRAARLLEFLDIAGLARRFPHELSGGQRQRAAVARALMNRPEVVLADEPTASLDRANATAVMALLGAYQQQEGAALIVATHDLTLLEGFDRVVTLQPSGEVTDHA